MATAVIAGGAALLLLAVEVGLPSSFRTVVGVSAFVLILGGAVAILGSGELRVPMSDSDSDGFVGGAPETSHHGHVHMGDFGGHGGHGGH